MLAESHPLPETSPSPVLLRSGFTRYLRSTPPLSPLRSLLISIEKKLRAAEDDTDLRALLGPPTLSSPLFTSPLLPAGNIVSFPCGGTQ